MHNTVTIMFSPYYYSSTAIFLIKKKKERKRRRSQTLTLVFTVKKYNQLQGVLHSNIFCNKASKVWREYSLFHIPYTINRSGHSNTKKTLT